MENRRETQVSWKGAAAGAVGGLIAAFVMNQFQAVLKAESKEPEKKKGDDATVKAANAICLSLFDHELTRSQKKWAGPAVHYALGTTLGAVYGAMAACPEARAGAGTSYGAAVWLAADEVAVPMLGFSGPPTETPVSGHVNALASHFVFGLVTHFARKILLRLDSIKHP
jgi:putative membrane protein